ncbi:cyclic nucleotide-binding domain-containing protein 2-like [Rhinophrynus dorsalis]
MSDTLLTNTQRGSSRFRRTAINIKNVCGMLLSLKRYIGRNKVVEWALFHLQMQIHSRSDLLFNISSFSKNNMRKDFEKLKNLLSVSPKQRPQHILRQIQFCLKKNRAFQCLRDRTQLELCQHVIYQAYETQTLVIKQGHVPRECYLILSGSVNAVTEEVNSKQQNLSALYEVEEGDFLGDLGLITNERPTSFVCKSDVELLVIDKEAFNDILAVRVQEQYTGICDFLRNLPLFSSWPLEKIDLLAHCSLQRNYRAGAAVVVDSINSSSLVLVKSGKCLIVMHLTQERQSVDSEASRNYSSLLKKFPSISLLLERRHYSDHAFERPVFPRTSYSASYRTTLNQVHMRPRPQTAGPSTFSLQGRKDHCTLDGKGDTGYEKMRCAQRKVPTLSPSHFITVGTLEHGGVFGLAETIAKSSGLQFSLISEGAECIFIPTKLYLSEAPAKSRQIAQELVNSFPTEKMIRENYARHQTWRAYKDRIIGQQLTRDLKR